MLTLLLSLFLCLMFYVGALYDLWYLSFRVCCLLFCLVVWVVLVCGSYDFLVVLFLWFACCLFLVCRCCDITFVNCCKGVLKL